MNNLDMNAIMKMLSKMDKNQLEAGIAKANQILNSKSKEELLEFLDRLTLDTIYFSRGEFNEKN